MTISVNKTKLSLTDARGVVLTVTDSQDGKSKVLRLTNGSQIFLGSKNMLRLNMYLNPKKTGIKAKPKKTTRCAGPKLFDEIFNATCHVMQFLPAEITGKSKKREYVNGRAVLCYLAYQYTGMSYPEIAVLTKRTHASIIAVVRSFKKYRDDRTHNGQTLAEIAGQVEELLGIR